MIIYKHTNKTTGKSYVGQTKHTIHKRWVQHVGEAYKFGHKSYNEKFKNAIRKYGKEDWTHEILESCDESEANAKEIYWIEVLNSKQEGYNSTDGGETAPEAGIKALIAYNKSRKGIPLPEETRQKISKAGKGRVVSRDTRRKLSERMSTFVHTEEAKLKISKANKGRKHSKEVCDAAKIRNSGKGNPMYGKRQSEKTKKAVSSRRRSEADPTLRTWVHTSGKREENITCLALRDKYPELLISKLNDIAKERINKNGYRIGVSHKGWSIEKN